MKNEPSNMWVHPFSEEIDKRLKPIKRDIQRLKKSHLTSQKVLAKFIILSTANQILTMVHRQNPKIFSYILPQLTAELASSKSKIATSQDPLSIAHDFTAKGSDLLKKYNIDFIDLPA